MKSGWRLPWWSVLVIGVVLFSPAIRTVFLLDDYLHLSMVEGTFPAPRGPFQLYDFVDDDVRPALLERGLLPWWSHPKLTLRFFRPLSSALLWADHRVFGHAPLPMHLHSLVWWVLAVLAARALFRRTLSPRASTIATALFALAPCHAMPIAWLANREALVSLTFGTLALAAHVRWRAAMRARDGAVAAIFFALALLGGGEYAIAFGGYVLAMELVGGDPRSIARRALGLVPFVVPAALYLIVRGSLGYGAFGSGFYTDPMRDPIAFLREAPWRIVALIGEGWFTIDSRDWRSTTAHVALGAIVAIGLVMAIVVARRSLARHDAPVRRNGAWMLVGSLLAIVPSLAVMPAPRLLGVSAIGVAGVVALILDDVWHPERGPRSSAGLATDAAARKSELAQTVAVLLGFAHIVHGPVSSWLWSREFHNDAERVDVNARRLASHIGDASHAEIGVLRGTIGMFFAPFALDPRGRPPARWTVLSDAAHVLVLRRDARTLEVVAPRGRSLYPVGVGSLLRAPDAPLRTGDVVTIPGMSARIVDADPLYGVRDVVYTFDRDLAEAPTTWLNETSYAWVEASIPAVGFGSPFDP